MDRSFFDRWFDSVRVLLPGFLLFGLYGGYLLHDVYERDGFYERARESAQVTCLQDHDAQTCEGALQRRHERCAKMAYSPPGKVSARGFDQVFYEQCVFKYLTPADPPAS